MVNSHIRYIAHVRPADALATHLRMLALSLQLRPRLRAALSMRCMWATQRIWAPEVSKPDVGRPMARIASEREGAMLDDGFSHTPAGPALRAPPRCGFLSTQLPCTSRCEAPRPICTLWR